jgi:CRISPR-associated protein Csm3
MRNNIIITGTLQLQSGLHIGTGEMSQLTDATVIKEIGGKPFIPGSSIKGVLRTAAERLSRMVLTDGEDVCFLASDSNCSGSEQIKNDIKKELTGIKNYDDAIKKIEGKICPACSLFGSSHLASKVVVYDAKLVKERKDKVYTSIRHSLAIDRESGTANSEKGAKFDYEVVNPDLSFKFKIVAENLNQNDKNLLIVALNELLEERIYLGGKISRGLGRVKLINSNVEIFNFSSFKDSDAESKEALQQVKEEYLNSIINKFSKKTNKESDENKQATKQSRGKVKNVIKVKETNKPDYDKDKTNNSENNEKLIEWMQENIAVTN